jgi:dynein heavy chain, axonemal
MNILIRVIVKSLKQLDQGMKGNLSISDNMELLKNSLANGQVPMVWQNKAYPSLRGLGSWLENLTKRIEQLGKFEKSPEEDMKLVYINRLFNPQSFLTAIKQVKAKTDTLDLDKLEIHTDIINKCVEDISQPPPKRDGAYIFGLFVEGARYDFNTRQLEDSFPRQMYSLLPVIHARAVYNHSSQIKKLGEPHPSERNTYICPVYKTSTRLHQFVFEAQFYTKRHQNKWILAGVACILDVEGVSEVFVKPK